MCGTSDSKRAGSGDGKDLHRGWECFGFLTSVPKSRESIDDE